MILFNILQIRYTNDIKLENLISERSGSGKSILLYLLGTLDQPTSGELIIDEKQITTLSVDEIHHFRNKQL